MTAPRQPSRVRAVVSSCAIVLAGVALLAWADAYPRHGYSATWLGPGGVEITRTTEHRVDFPNAHRPLARYVQGWPFERVPLPVELPAIDAELRASVIVPPGPPLFFGTDADREAIVFIDGDPAPRPIASGRHRVRVRWTAQPRPHPRGGSAADTAHFRLTWGPRPQDQTPVPRDALRPLDARWPASRIALWIVALLLTLGTAIGVHRRRFALVTTVAVIAIGTGIRLFDYDVMPEFRENADELFATWNGWSLLDDGTTRGWSLWPGVYGGRVDHEEVRFFGETRPVISPYFEHPPLLHVLVGVAAHAGGARHWLEAKLAHTRLVPIALSALSLLVMIAIGRRLYPRSPAPWLGALLFAVVPTISLQTRVIKEEILLVPLSLGMIWFFLRWRDDGRRLRELVFAAVCAGLAPLAKVPAIVYVPALVMLVAHERGEWKRAALATAIGFAVASTLLIFGAVIDWDVFVLTQSQQGTRPTHWNLFPRFFDATLINHNLIGRGWILFLWIAFAAATFKRGFRDSAVLTVPLTTYLIAIAIGSGNWTFGWYIVPLYPLLCIGAGAFLAELWERPTFLGGTLFVVLLVMYSLNFELDPHWAKQPEAWPPIRKMVTITTALALAPYALAQVWRRNDLCVGLARTVTAIGLAAVVVLGARFVIGYDTGFERYRDFDRDTYFHR